LQAETEHDVKFVVTGTASAYLLGAMRIEPLPAWFVIPAQPLKAAKPPSRADWVTKSSMTATGMIVRRDGLSMRLYSRNAYD
jgi:hypothetical protein